MNEKGNSKIWGIIFVVVIVVLLFAHYTSVNQIKKGYETDIKKLNEKVSVLQKDLDDNLMKVKKLEFRLKLEKIKLSASKNDFGTAALKLKKFTEELGAAGCKKLDKLAPYFEKADTKLLKLDKTVFDELDNIEKIIFSSVDNEVKKNEEKKEKEETK